MAELYPDNLHKIFQPSSIAVVGTHKIKGTVPYDILENLLKAEFNGLIFPVSPKEQHILSLKAYRYVLDIPDPVDLAIIVFPSSVVHMALEQCGQKGIKSAIIISAGFREVGEKGLEKENQVREIARKYGISIIGPNCLGVINTDPAVNLNASFARKMPEEGSIAFLSQSGALCTAVLDYARAKHIGFSKFISFGNKVDITEVDLLNYLMEDEKTKVILIYLEEITDGRALMEAASRVIKRSHKPVLILKSGRTRSGASAAASHTGSLAGDDAVCDAAFAQAGIIRCDNIEEMFNKAIAFAYQPAPASNKVAIITNAGGPGVLTSDSAEKEGLALAKFSEETTSLFRKNLPATANIKNPVDVIGDARADRYEVAMSGAFNDPEVSGVFVILTPQSMTDIDSIAHEVVKMSKQSDKPVYASFMGEADVASGVDILLRNKIPHYILPESMCKSFASVYRFYENLSREDAADYSLDNFDISEAERIINEAVKSGRKALLEYQATAILKCFGIPVVKNGLACSKQAAIDLAGNIGYPVVMKIMSEQVIHKFDFGGIVLNIRNEHEAGRAYDTILEKVGKSAPEAHIDGVLVSAMIDPGQEVILGLKKDPAFGPVVMFGLGGIFVEIFRDVIFRVAPISRQASLDMISRIKTYPILTGARGGRKKDVPSLSDSIIRLSQLAIALPQIRELDINPLIVLGEGQGCRVADAKIMI
ncbi:MAG TPA: acetate--CoA ligase family protein [Cyclobacteriaceae bacterium]|nr:acetate--CoA ligase family protein [Cyclobacteriaceae bacterium]